MERCVYVMYKYHTIFIQETSKSEDLHFEWVYNKTWTIAFTNGDNTCKFSSILGRQDPLMKYLGFSLYDLSCSICDDIICPKMTAKIVIHNG